MQGEVLSYPQMCLRERVNLQRGMNFRLREGISVILMSQRPGAPYVDRVEDDGKTLIYEGHDVAKTADNPSPKQVDQPIRYPGGKLTQNGLFFEAALRAKNGESDAEMVRVYEKIQPGIWVYNGMFRLSDAWQERTDGRLVFKFKLESVDLAGMTTVPQPLELDHTRLIPSAVKLEVWRRDKGRCAKCGSSDNLHFDHIIPYSRGGTSLMAANIQLLCARHNLEKRDRIE